MTERRIPYRAIAIGFAAAVVVLGVLITVVGVGDVLRALESADGRIVLVAFATAVLWMVSWSATLYLVLGSLSVPMTVTRAVLVYSNVLFANDIAPFSVGGAEPIAALFVSRTTGTNYETGFVAVVSTDLLNFIPAPGFAILGLLSVTTSAVLGDRYELVVISLLAVSLLFVLVGALSWEYRRWIARRALPFLAGAQGIAVRFFPSRRLPDRETIADQLDTVIVGLEQVLSNRRVRRLGVVTSAIGWVLQGVVLWLSLYALGHAVPVEQPVFIVSIVTVTDLVPLPGGIGSVDAALVLLLVGITGLPAATATAAALVHRGATFWFPVVLCGLLTGVVQSNVVTRR